MKAYFAIVVILGVIIGANSARALSIVLEDKVVEGNSVLTLTIFTVQSLKLNKIPVSVSAFSLISEEYAEGYGGLAYSPKPWVEVGASVGMETADSPWRIAGSVWMGKEPVSLLAIYENGGSGYWYKVTATVAARKWLTVGLLAKRFGGVGPIVQISIPGTPIKAYIVPAYDFEFEQQKTLVGISLGI